MIEHDALDLNMVFPPAPPRRAAEPPEYEDGLCAMCGLFAFQGRVYNGWSNSGPGKRHIIHADPDAECGPPLPPPPLPPVAAGPPPWPDDPELNELRARFDRPE